MPFNNVFELDADDVSLATDNNVTRITIKNLSEVETVYFRVTVGTSLPTITEMLNSLPIGPGEGELNLVLTEAFPGLSGANRVYLYSKNAARVFLSHD